jgi:glutamine amidotransferase
MIVVVDYNMGNMASIRNALEFLGATFVISRDIETIKKADKLILPGVGSFRKAMSYLKEYELIDVLNDLVLIKKTPILGICLGMQLLADLGSEDTDEAHPTKGLGWIPGKVVKMIPSSVDFRIPHMGFNELQIKKEQNVLKGIPSNAHFYFVHSYQFLAENKEHVLASTDYDSEVVAVVGRENICGVQFHPEKSQGVGLKLLKNFVDAQTC